MFFFAAATASYAFVLPLNVNTAAFGHSPFFRSLCLPHFASAHSQQRRAVLGLDSGVCLRWSGGSLVDPRFRLAASSPRVQPLALDKEC